jgi:hypothetical protein
MFTPAYSQEEKSIFKKCGGGGNTVYFGGLYSAAPSIAEHESVGIEDGSSFQRIISDYDLNNFAIEYFGYSR